MIRQLIIPGIIAGALHGGLLLIPSPPAPPLTKVMAVVIEPFPEPPQVPVIPDDDPGRPPGDDRVEAPSVPVVPMSPPVVIADGGITDVFTIDLPRANVDPHAMKVNPGDYTKQGLTGGGDGSGMKLFTIDKLDKTPRTVFQIAPDYPSEAKKNSLTGKVTVVFAVDENGDVHDARVADTTDNIFSEAALRAVSRWRFEPGLLHGKRVAFKMSVPITFSLSEGE